MACPADVSEAAFFLFSFFLFPNAGDGTEGCLDKVVPQLYRPLYHKHTMGLIGSFVQAFRETVDEIIKDR